MKIAPALVILAALLVSACAGAQPPVPHAVTATIPAPSKPPATLEAAIQHAAHLGRARTGTTVYLSFALRPRQPALLSSLIASGRTVSPAEYAAEFAADPALVGRAESTLRGAGFAVSWTRGSDVIAADGSAPAADELLGVDIQSYRLADGTTFYATLDEPGLPGPVAAVASGVSGLDSYRAARPLAVRPGGLTTTDLLSFYNLKPLRDQGLDGQGQTVVLPEIDDLPDFKDLDAFAAKFGLPPFEPILTVKRSPSWGTPEKPQGETAMDLEILHEIAPAAKLVVYLSAADFGHGDRAFDQMVTEHLGSIISESLGACEPDTSSGHRNAYATIEDRAVAQGMSHFVATGDNGAYTCGFDTDPAGSFPSTLPTVTAVGGTTVFQSQEGVYFKEFAWGSPLDQSGGGGGASQVYPVPAWQRNESVAAGHGMRQVPDVSADADPMTGYQIVFAGAAGEAGGTSAATPLWAATVALINEDLVNKGLREVGFANPALYYMGENASRYAARPFHDVTAGNNLAYAASAGWDFATGWGSMDGQALDAAWTSYIKGGGA